jgi:hypothetical protein
MPYGLEQVPFSAVENALLRPGWDVAQSHQWEFDRGNWGRYNLFVWIRFLRQIIDFLQA